MPDVQLNKEVQPAKNFYFAGVAAGTYNHTLTRDIILTSVHLSLSSSPGAGTKDMIMYVDGEIIASGRCSEGASYNKTINFENWVIKKDSILTIYEEDDCRGEFIGYYI